MLQKIIQNCIRVVTVVGPATLLVFLLLLAADTILFNIPDALFEALVTIFIVFGGVLFVSSLVYIIVIIGKVFEQSFEQISKKEIMFSFISIMIAFSLFNLFLQEFYRPY